MCQLACKGDIIKEGGGLAEGGGCKGNMITAVWSMDDDDNYSWRILMMMLTMILIRMPMVGVVFANVIEGVTFV